LRCFSSWMLGAQESCCSIGKAKARFRKLRGRDQAIRENGRNLKIIRLTLSRLFLCNHASTGNICLNPEFSTMARVSNVAVLSINRLCHSLLPQTTRINPDGKKLDHARTSLRQSVGPGHRIPQCHGRR
jgi:hypothetical protein